MPAYAEILQSEISFRIGISIALVCLFLVWTVCVLKGWIRTDGKKDMIASLVVLWCFAALLFGALGWDIQRHRMDLHEQAYVVYEGDFSCRQARVGKSNYGAKIYLPTEDEEIGLEVKSRELSYGEYVGRVVYAKRTQKLLEFEIYETKPQE
jgi:hypothetical protein